MNTRVPSANDRRGTIGLGAGVCFALAALAGSAAVRAAIILDTVTVRVYDSTGLAASDRSAALSTAANILSRAELDVAWTVCTQPHTGRAPAACDTPPAAHELVVRLTNSSPASDGNRRAFGYSLIDATTGSGTLSTVYVDRVDWLASTGKASRADVLGRAVAHELGHLLLGSNAHTANGLMRETWTADELMRNRSDDWRFLPSQRAALRARSAGWNGPGRRAARDARGQSPGSEE